MSKPRAEALEPEVRRLLEVMHGDGSRRLANRSPAEARRALAQLPDIGPGEEPLPRVEDQLARAVDGRAVPVRLYAPTRRHGLPVLVYLHGGGWVTGGLDVNDYRCRRLAKRSGCLLVAVGYRLAPEHPFPAALEDAYAVLGWAARDARSAGGDPGLVAIAGDSSGANLAAAASLLARDRGGPTPVFQLLTCPITDREFDSASMRAYGEGLVLECDDLRWCWDHYLPDEDHAASAYASPLRAERLEGLPPALIITAELDPLRDQGEAYARRLHAAGVSVTLSRYAGMIHSFVDFEGSLDAAAQALDESAEALKAAWRREASVSRPRPEGAS